MGLNFSSLYSYFFGKEKVKIIMIGLDVSGMTTILYKFKLDKVMPTVPTMGFNVEEFNHKNVSFVAWDVGMRNSTRLYWKYYFKYAQGLIYVVDSNDRERIDEARQVLAEALKEEELHNTVLLVFANKQDLPDAMSTSELTEKLGLRDIKDRLWHIQPSSGISGEGLHEGLDWIVSHLNK
ncbi:hypothetical protein FO519_002963 [Halicephalobus sp. NKZ332]|nr:hypothetical protein FO519_002963 [Halicephalobus sp. NKZ332]